MWFFIVRLFPVRLCMSGCITESVHNNLRTFCPFYCTAWNQRPLSNPANWQWSSLFRRKTGVKWLISSRSRQFKPPILNHSTDPFAVRVIRVTLLLTRGLLGSCKTTFFFICVFPQRNFYIDATVWPVFLSLKLALKCTEQTRRGLCFQGEELLGRQNLVVRRPGFNQISHTVLVLLSNKNLI